MDSDTSRDEFCEQMGNSGGSFTIAGYDYSPFEIFSKLFGANLPLAERRRFLVSNVNEGPMPCQGEGRLFIRQRPAKNEVVVPMHQDANHFSASLQARVCSLLNRRGSHAERQARNARIHCTRQERMNEWECEPVGIQRQGIAMVPRLTKFCANSAGSRFSRGEARSRRSPRFAFESGIRSCTWIGTSIGLIRC